MKNLRLIVGSTIGGIVGSLAMYVFLAWASQTYVLPTSGTDHGTEHLTNIPNRDEAQRSTFSGINAPTSPTPLEGQLWYETDTDVPHYYDGTQWLDLAVRSLNNSFNANQTVSSASSPKLVVTDTTTPVTAELNSGDSSADTGTFTNHSFCVKTNNNCRSTWDTSGNQTTAGGELRTTNGDDHTATAACASGYTRVGLWCYDTDGVPTTIRTITVDESAYASTATVTGAKAVLVHVEVDLTQDSGSSEFVELTACTNPGDSGNTICADTAYGSVVATVQAASETKRAVNDVIVRTDSSANLRTYCNNDAGTPSTLECRWSLLGYLD